MNSRHKIPVAISINHKSAVGSTVGSVVGSTVGSAVRCTVGSVVDCCAGSEVTVIQMRTYIFENHLCF